MNNQGMNELRYRNRSEDNNTSMSPTLNNQHSPFSTNNRTVFEVFPVSGVRMNQYSGSENNVATMKSAVPGSIGNRTGQQDNLVSEPQQMTVKIDQHKTKSQPIHTITHLGGIRHLCNVME